MLITDLNDPSLEGKYTAILADPPWRYRDKCKAGKRGVEYKYRTMPLGEIMGLPVGKIAARDSMLFLWATCPQLPVALQVMDAWGFAFKTVGLVWVKTTGKAQLNGVASGLAWGMGNWTRSNSELVLLGVHGRPNRVDAGVHQVIISPRQKHSVKPSETFSRITSLLGEVPRIELFGRGHAYYGWDIWGDEAGEDNETIR